MHLLLDAKIIDADTLANNLHNWLTNAPERIGMTRISPVIVEYNAQSILGIVLLAESHISIHADLKDQIAYVDFYTCKELNIDTTVALIKEIGLEQSKMTVLQRGLEYL